jgi:hypothetical protein
MWAEAFKKADEMELVGEVGEDFGETEEEKNQGVGGGLYFTGGGDMSGKEGMKDKGGVEKKVKKEKKKKKEKKEKKEKKKRKNDERSEEAGER